MLAEVYLSMLRDLKVHPLLTLDKVPAVVVDLLLRDLAQAV